MKRNIILAGAALAAVIGVGSAGAANPHRTLATPAAACRALEEFGANPYSSYGQCLANLKRDVAAYQFPDEQGELITLDERCTQFEEGVTDPETGETFQITYPFTFEEGPEWPFPVLTAQNHGQCEIALYTYHTLAIGG
jgi:hypothetical protein